MTADRRTRLATVVARRVMADGPDGEVDPGALVDALLPLVDALCAEAAADALRDAADAALPLGRRGPSAIADWLLDCGAVYRAAQLHTPREDT